MGKIFCKKCGKENPDDSIFCSECGSPLKTKRDNKKIILIVICICLLVAIIVVCAVKYKKSSESENTGQKESETEMTTEKPKVETEETETAETEVAEEDSSKFRKKVYTFSYEGDEDGVEIELDYKSAHSGYATITYISYYEGKKSEDLRHGSFVEDSNGNGKVSYSSEELDYQLDYESEPAKMTMDFYGTDLEMYAQEEQ